jgi:methylmalonyl-CoA/ethylmalonyl-CoA epimerase
MLHEEVNEEQGVREAMVRRRRLRLLHPTARAAVEESTIAKFLDRNGPASSRWPTASPTSTQVAAILRERGVRLLYDAQARHEQQPRQLHPPQGRRRRAGRARRAGGETAH